MISRRPPLRRRPGLRVRFVLALVGTSLATLAAALLIVSPPLQHRLERDRLADLRGLARTARPALRAVPEDELRPGSPRLDEIVERLQIRTGGRTAVLDDTGAVLADSSRTPVVSAARLVARARAAAHGAHDGVASTERAGQAIVATAVRGDDGRRLTLVLSKPLNDARAAADTVRSAFPLALLVALVVALLVALLVSGGLMRRLRDLRDDARALGEDGLGHEVAVRGADEVAEVAGALEAMRVRLVEAEASRQAFVATASHELRTPLASLQATLELLREQAARPATDPAAAEARIDTALRQTHRLVSLATDLLDLSRVDGGAPVHGEPIELAELCGAIAREFAGRVDAEGRTLDVDGGPVHALADPAAAARIVRILLDNALAHGAGAVRLTVAADDDRATITVRDEGPGLAAGDEEQVFARFHRGRTAAGHPGFGLGLPIARGLARALHGDVRACPDGPGGCFAAELPVWRPGPDGG